MASYWSAAFQGDIERVTELLDAGQNIDEYPPPNETCYRPTALAYAVWGNQPEMVKYLLERGANPDRYDGDGNYSPLHWASYQGDHADCAEHLVEAGADLEARSWANRDGFTPLEMAEGRNQVVSRKPGVMLVLEAAARQPRLPWTPLPGSRTASAELPELPQAAAPALPRTQEPAPADPIEGPATPSRAQPTSMPAGVPARAAATRRARPLASAGGSGGGSNLPMLRCEASATGEEQLASPCVGPFGLRWSVWRASVWLALVCCLLAHPSGARLCLVGGTAAPLLAPLLARDLRAVRRWGARRLAALRPAARRPWDARTPTQFVCPITNEVMSDPVSTADGHAFERTAIERWLRAHDTSPMTGAPLTHKHLTPNHALRSLIDDWRG